MTSQIPERAPTVSIGIPLHNHENYVGEAIESILAQTLGDFELIISDNASTDGSYEVCVKYAAADNRIRLFRNDRNLGAAPNMNLVFQRARGRYFKWAHSDDLMLPRFLDRTVTVLESDESASCCTAMASWIDDDGQPIGECSFDARLASTATIERLTGVLEDVRRFAIHGVYRVSLLKKTALHGSFADSDCNLLFETALQGRIVLVDEELHRIRKHAGGSIVRYPNPRDRQVFYNTDKSSSTSTPTVTSIVEHLRSILRHERSVIRRMRFARLVLSWYLSHRPRSVLGDLRIIAVRSLGPAGESKAVSG